LSDVFPITTPCDCCTCIITISIIPSATDIPSDIPTGIPAGIPAGIPIPGTTHAPIHTRAITSACPITFPQLHTGRLAIANSQSARPCPR
jgi:hypothetical protein